MSLDMIKKAVDGGQCLAADKDIPQPYFDVVVKGLQWLPQERTYGLEHLCQILQQDIKVCPTVCAAVSVSCTCHLKPRGTRRPPWSDPVITHCETGSSWLMNLLSLFLWPQEVTGNEYESLVYISEKQRLSLEDQLARRLSAYPEPDLGPGITRRQRKVGKPLQSGTDHNTQTHVSVYCKGWAAKQNLHSWYRPYWYCCVSSRLNRQSSGVY